MRNDPKHPASWGLPGGRVEAGETLITACGSPCYAAPEMIAGLPYLGARVDTWSCGVIMFALICGYLPFEDPITTNLYQKILKGEF
jgi:serine/threonine protein kinase